MKNPCQRVTLAARGSFRVEQCSCGSINVSIGAVTVRLDATSARGLELVLSEAMAAHHMLMKQASKPSLRVVPNAADAFGNGLDSACDLGPIGPDGKPIFTN